MAVVDNKAAIDQLEDLLKSGLRSHTVDGVTTTYSSTNEIRKTINALKEADNVNAYPSRRRARSVRFGSIY